MKLDRLEVLSQSEIKQIHQHTLEILANTGIRVSLKKMRELLADSGGKVDETSKMVRFPPAMVEEFVKKVNVNLQHGSFQACYIPSSDEVKMPNIEDFENETVYYSTLFHELIHWTGASKRLDRFKKDEEFDEYAFEELVAEIGATFLCGHFGIENTKRIDNSKAYIQGWSKRLNNDSQMIFKASAKAQKAFDLLIK